MAYNKVHNYRVPVPVLQCCCLHTVTQGFAVLRLRMAFGIHLYSVAGTRTTGSTSMYAFLIGEETRLFVQSDRDVLFMPLQCDGAVLGFG